MGLLLGDLIFQVPVLIVADRKQLHIALIVSLASLCFIIGFNKLFGPFLPYCRQWCDCDIIRRLQFVAINSFAVSISYVFALMPRFRHVSRYILNTLVVAVAVVCVLYCVTDIVLANLLVAIVVGLHLVILTYVTIYMIKSVNPEYRDTYFWPVMYVLYLIFVAWTAVHAIQNREEVFTHFLVGSVFPVV
ncbi:MAG: hypothetical protein K6F33_09210, partial [Bacteroidales bacterium]|nr:hypothetical protein [Bacteroidales bacterium]